MPVRSQFASEEEWLAHLRLYFAAKAMQTILVGYEKQKEDKLEITEWLDAAKDSYDMADAMLEARK